MTSGETYLKFFKSAAIDMRYFAIGQGTYFVKGDWIHLLSLNQLG